jgi:hypothetical protein
MSTGGSMMTMKRRKMTRTILFALVLTTTAASAQMPELAPDADQLLGFNWFVFQRCIAHNIKHTMEDLVFALDALYVIGAMAKGQIKNPDKANAFLAKTRKYADKIGTANFCRIERPVIEELVDYARKHHPDEIASTRQRYFDHPEELEELLK